MKGSTTCLSDETLSEYLRIIDAFTHVQEKGEVCPANWEEGKDAMNANREGVQSYLSSH